MSIKPEDRYFDSNGAAIRYVVAGEGEPVVLVHGYLMDIEKNWLRTRGDDTSLLETLAEEYQVIALDSRGHGKSGKPHEPGAYGIEMVCDVMRLLDHIGIERAHIVGYSDGADITLKFLELYPSRVNSVVLCASGGIRQSVNAVESERFGQAVADALEQGSGLRDLVLDLWPVNGPSPSDDAIAARSERLLSGQDALALALVARGWKEWAVSDEALQELDMPVLAVVGDRDPSKSSVDALLDILPQLEVVVIEGADHAQTFSHIRFKSAVRQFLTGA